MVGSLVALVGFASWFAAVAPLSAGADSVGTIQSQIAAKQAQIIAAAGRIHTLAQQYTQASLAAGDMAQQVAADNTQVAVLKQKMASDRRILRQQAISSYTGGAVSGINLDTQTGGTDPSVRAEYIQIAFGDVTDTVDQYHLQQRELAAAEAVLRQQEAQLKAQARVADAARKAALSEASKAQNQLNQLQAELVQAQQAAAQQAVVTRASTPVIQGAPVNNGLRTTVQNLVSPPPRAPAPAPAPPVASGGGGAGGVWLALRQCESGNNYAINTGNGFYGAYQFTQSTWSSLGYPGRPDLEPPAMQDAAAQKLQAIAGWGQWPACSAALGLR